MERKALVFVSCGQVLPAEIKLGHDICALIETVPGLTSYFAQKVTSAEALSSNIFRNLREAAAVIAVMHHRGTVTGRPGDDLRTRASVWIEQEIAIAAFLASGGDRKIEIAAYAQRGLSREGVRDNLILNPFEFNDESEILGDVRTKLASWHLEPPRPTGARVSLDIQYVKMGNSTGERHIHELKVTMTNTGSAVIEDFDASLEFPAVFVGSSPGTIGIERQDLAHDGYRVFRHANVNKTRLLPGDRLSILPLTYYITTELYLRRPADLALPVTAQVYVAGQLAGQTSTPFRELQNF